MISDATIIFPHLGITLTHVGKNVNVFGFRIAYYGITIAFGMWLGITLIQTLARRTGQDPDFYFDLSLITLILSVIGARLYYVVFSWEEFRDDWLEIFNIRGGGLAIYGGILTGIGTIAVISRIRKKSLGCLLDTCMPGVCLGQIVGRWGNFFNREAFGEYTDAWTAMALPRNAVYQTDITEQMLEHLKVVDGVEMIQVHPTFLYESCWNLLLLILILAIFRKKRYNGQIMLIYLCGYGTGRFLIEGLRTDQLLLPFTDLPVSQLLSAVLVGVAVLLMSICEMKVRRTKQIK